MHPIDTGEMNASSEREEATPYSHQERASSTRPRQDSPRNNKSSDHGKTSKSLWPF